MNNFPSKKGSQAPVYLVNKNSSELDKKIFHINEQININII
jgi:hypothetical protein